jgi:hypothetical protein
VADGADAADAPTPRFQISGKVVPSAQTRADASRSRHKLVTRPSASRGGALLGQVGGRDGRRVRDGNLVFANGFEDAP